MSIKKLKRWGCVAMFCALYTHTLHSHTTQTLSALNKITVQLLRPKNKQISCFTSVHFKLSSNHIYCFAKDNPTNVPLYRFLCKQGHMRESSTHTCMHTHIVLHYQIIISQTAHFSFHQDWSKYSCGRYIPGIFSRGVDAQLIIVEIKSLKQHVSV